MPGVVQKFGRWDIVGCLGPSRSSVDRAPRVYLRWSRSSEGRRGGGLCRDFYLRLPLGGVFFGGGKDWGCFPAPQGEPSVSRRWDRRRPLPPPTWRLFTPPLNPYGSVAVAQSLPHSPDTLPDHPPGFDGQKGLWLWAGGAVMSSQSDSHQGIGAHPCFCSECQFLSLSFLKFLL